MQAGGTRFFSQAMVGRTAELDTLRQVAAAAAGQAQAVFIYGEAGIGKSRLTAALQETWGGQVRWLTGQTDSILRRAFNPFTYLLQSYFAQYPEAPAIENRTRFEQQLQALAEAVASESLRAELLRTASFLGALLNLQWDDSLYAQLTDAKLRHENTLTALRTFLLALSTVQPLVVELEDGHWLDEASRELLARLTRQTTAYPILLLITARYADDGSAPTFPVEEWPATRLALRQLSSDALRTLVEQQLGPVDDGLYAFLEARSQGVPFFAQQLALYLQETGALERPPASGVAQPAWRLRAATQEIPDTLNAMLIARLDRLSAEVKQVVQTAAVLGREFDVRLLSRMLRAEVRPAVAAAEHEQIWNALTELLYLFKHALLHDAAYEMQLRARLRGLHALALAAYEQLYAADTSPYYEELAYHAEHSSDTDKQREYFAKAGAAARANYRNAAALEYYGRLLPLLTDAAVQFEIHHQRGQVLELLGRWAEAEADYRAALALAGGDITLLAHAHYALGKLCRLRGDYETALEWLKSAQVGCAAMGDQSGLTQVWIETGMVLSRRGDYAQAHAALDQGLAQAQATGDTADVALALNHLGNVAFYQSNYVGARTFYTESLALRRALGDKRGIAASLGNQGTAAYYQGDAGAARALHEESLVFFRELGDKWGLATALINLGIMTNARGDFMAARAFHAESLTLYREMGDKSGIAAALANLGVVAESQEDYGTARTFHAESLALKREMGEKWGLAISLTNLGSVAMRQGDYTAARALKEECLTLCQELNAKRIMAYTLLGLGLIDLAEHSPTARQLIVQGLRLSQEIGEKLPQTASLVGLAGVALQAGDARCAARWLGAATSALRALNARIETDVQPLHAQILAETQMVLGEDAFQAVWAAGQAMTLEVAVGEALEANLT